MTPEQPRELVVWRCPYGCELVYGISHHPDCPSPLDTELERIPVIEASKVEALVSAVKQYVRAVNGHLTGEGMDQFTFSDAATDLDAALRTFQSAGLAVTHEQPREQELELDVCQSAACGYVVSADGDSTGCPYCGARCERITVFEASKVEGLEQAVKNVVEAEYDSSAFLEALAALRTFQSGPPCMSFVADLPGQEHIHPSLIRILIPTPAHDRQVTRHWSREQHREPIADLRAKLKLCQEHCAEKLSVMDREVDRLRAKLQAARAANEQLRVRRDEAEQERDEQASKVEALVSAIVDHEKAHRIVFHAWNDADMRLWTALRAFSKEPVE